MMTDAEKMREKQRIADLKKQGLWPPKDEEEEKDDKKKFDEEAYLKQFGVDQDAQEEQKEED